MGSREAAVRIHLTRLGWQFAFIGLFAMLGGAVRSYNLPLVLAGLIVGALVLQWRWGRQMILAVSLKRQLPAEAFADQSFAVRFSVTNHSRWLPAWLLQIDDPIRSLGPANPSGARSRPRRRPAFAITASCGLGVVPALSRLTAQYDCTIARRGRYQFGPTKLSSSIPLGLMLAAHSGRDAESFYVFPRRLRLRRHWRQILQSRTGGNATNSRRSGTQEGEFFGIRGWQAGDSRRWIHWRTTARIGEPAVRQFEQQRRFELCILVDGFLPATDPAVTGGDGAPRNESLELVISAAATLVTELIATPNNKVGLVLAGQQISALTSGGGREQTIAMLRQLTDLAGSPTPDLSGAVRQMIRTVGRPQDLLVISPRTMIEQSHELANLIARRSSLRWCSVADGSIDQLVERSPSGPLPIESRTVPLAEAKSAAEGKPAAEATGATH